MEWTESGLQGWTGTDQNDWTEEGSRFRNSSSRASTVSLNDILDDHTLEGTAYDSFDNEDNHFKTTAESITKLISGDDVVDGDETSELHESTNSEDENLLTYNDSLINLKGKQEKEIYFQNSSPRTEISTGTREDSSASSNSLNDLGRDDDPVYCGTMVDEAAEKSLKLSIQSNLSCNAADHLHKFSLGNSVPGAAGGEQGRSEQGRTNFPTEMNNLLDRNIQLHTNPSNFRPNPLSPDEGYSSFSLIRENFIEELQEKVGTGQEENRVPGRLGTNAVHRLHQNDVYFRTVDFDNFSKEVDDDVVISKDKVLALKEYFEGIYRGQGDEDGEQCKLRKLQRSSSLPTENASASELKTDKSCVQSNRSILTNRELMRTSFVNKITEDKHIETTSSQSTQQNDFSNKDQCSRFSEIKMEASVKETNFNPQLTRMRADCRPTDRKIGNPTGKKHVRSTSMPIVTQLTSCDSFRFKVDCVRTKSLKTFTELTNRRELTCVDINILDSESELDEGQAGKNRDSDAQRRNRLSTLTEEDIKKYMLNQDAEDINTSSTPTLDTRQLYTEESTRLVQKTHGEESSSNAPRDGIFDRLNKVDRDFTVSIH